MGLRDSASLRAPALKITRLSGPGSHDRLGSKAGHGRELRPERVSLAGYPSQTSVGIMCSQRESGTNGILLRSGGYPVGAGLQNKLQ